MVATDAQVKFDVPASLRKWPSLRNERLTDTQHPSPYLLLEGTLDECVNEFMAKPVSQHHLYEIHTESQPPLVNAVVSAKHIVELARLRDLYLALK